jgi:hypothetical protein
VDTTEVRQADDECITFCLDYHVVWATAAGRKWHMQRMWLRRLSLCLCICAPQGSLSLILCIIPRVPCEFLLYAAAGGLVMIESAGRSCFITPCCCSASRQAGFRALPRTSPPTGAPGRAAHRPCAMRCLRTRHHHGSFCVCCVVLHCAFASCRHEAVKYGLAAVDPVHNPCVPSISQDINHCSRSCLLLCAYCPAAAAAARTALVLCGL